MLSPDRNNLKSIDDTSARSSVSRSGRPWLRVAIVCALVAVAGFVAFRILRSEGPARRGARDVAVPVVVADAVKQNFMINLSALGTVQAFNSVDVRTQITGTIDKIGFTEGQTVHEGDLVAQIDPRPLEAALGQAEAALARDQANLANARRDLDRYQSLAKQGYSTVQQLDTQRAAVAQSEAAIKGDEAAVAGAKTNLSYARITAPIAGVTGLREIDVGNVVHPTDTTGIVTITTVEPIAVVFTVPSQHLLKVQTQMSKGSLVAAAYDQDNKVLLDTGALTVVDNQVDQKTGTVRMKAVFQNKDRKLWPGAFVNVRLTIDNQQMITVPSTAIQHGSDGAYVYLVDGNNKAAMHAVKVGDSHDNIIAIEDGLNEGDKVVIDGQARLAEGARVQLVSDKAKSGTASAPKS